MAFLRFMRSLLIVLVTLALIGLILWLLGSAFLHLPTNVQTAIAGLSGVILAPIIAFITARSLERRRILDASIRDKKTQLYDDAIKQFMLIFDLGNTKKNPPNVVKMFADLTPRMITYASRGVINAWTAFRLNSVEGNPAPKNTMLLFENVLKAMRKDLGHNTTFQQQGELLRLWVNDVTPDSLKNPTPVKSEKVSPSKTS